MKRCLWFFLFTTAIFCKTNFIYAQDVNARIEALKTKRDYINENVVGKPFQSFNIKSGKKKFTNETLKGKVVFLNFWFENCPPCRAEFRSLNWLYNNYKDSEEFEFISLTFEEYDAIDRVKNQFNVQFPIYYLSSQNCQKLMYESGYPTNIILDKDGIVKYFFAGGFTNEGEVFKYFEKLKPLIDDYIKK